MTAKRSVVLGCGSYLPQRVLTNAELAARIDTSDEWIVQRTGIRQRHIAAEGEFTSHLAINAARAALTHGILLVKLIWMRFAVRLSRLSAVTGRVLSSYRGRGILMPRARSAPDITVARGAVAQ